MLHDVARIFLWILAIPAGLFLVAFLAALVDCTYAALFPSHVPVLDDLF
jgi:hypothetical protein